MHLFPMSLEIVLILLSVFHSLIQSKHVSLVGLEVNLWTIPEVLMLGHPNSSSLGA